MANFSGDVVGDIAGICLCRGVVASAGVGDQALISYWKAICKESHHLEVFWCLQLSQPRHLS